jgi:phosphoribosylamine--glycine ligase
MADVLLAVARGGLDRFLPLEVKNEACVGVVLASAGYPGNHERGKTITGLADAARMPGVELFHAGTARDGDRLVTSGGRVLVVTATAASMTEAAVRAYEAADRIQFEGRHLRRDIAAGGVRPSRI